MMPARKIPHHKPIINKRRFCRMILSLFFTWSIIIRYDRAKVGKIFQKTKRKLIFFSYETLCLVCPGYNIELPSILQHLTMTLQHLTMALQILTITLQHLTIILQHLTITLQHITIDSIFSWLYASYRMVMNCKMKNSSISIIFPIFALFN